MVSKGKQEHENFSYWGKLLQEAPDSYKEWFEAERKYLGTTAN